MEYLKQAEKEFDKVAVLIPKFDEICKKNKLPAGAILGGSVSFIVLLASIFQGYNIVVAVLTCVYPILMSIRTI